MAGFSATNVPSINAIGEVARVSYDPNYDPDFLYCHTKLFALLYDEIYMWYPVQKVAEEYGAANELLDLIESKIIIPVGDSRWWDRKLRREWPDFAGEWNDLDQEISRQGLFLSFNALVGDEDEFRHNTLLIAQKDAEDKQFSAFVGKLRLKPYKYILQTRDISEWFAACFHSHREVAKTIGSYEVVARDHREIWRYLFQKMAKEELQRLSTGQSALVELASKLEYLRAVEYFLDQQQLLLPTELTVNEIIEFRKKGAAKKFRAFLARAFEAVQKRDDFQFGKQLVVDFNQLSHSYERKRRLVSQTLGTMIAGPIVWVTTTLNPALGATTSFALASHWKDLTDCLEGVYDRLVGKKFSDYTWVLHLADFGKNR